MGIIGNNFIGQQIFPGIYSNEANRKIKAFDKKIDEAEVDNIRIKDLDELLTQIKADIERQYDRKKGLEDKVKAILFSISISITAITFSLGYEKKDLGDALQITALIIFVPSILYFIASAIISVKTLLPIPFHLVQSELDYDGKSNTISVVRYDKKEQYQSLVIAKWKNDNSNNIIANYTYSALKLLRNGLILFMVYFMIALVDKKISSFTSTSTLVFEKVNLKVNDSVYITLPYHYKGNGDSVLLHFETPIIRSKIRPQKKKLPVQSPRLMPPVVKASIPQKN